MAGIREAFEARDWQGRLENFSNDRIVEFFTRPLGLGIIATLMVLSIVYKWRILFAFLAGSLAVSFLVRSTLTGAETGPNKTLLAFAGGGVVIGAFIIYYVFIREE
jgi:Na+-transporting NADH:ubiquinone oxidoreductase subunit NqrB